MKNSYFNENKKLIIRIPKGTTKHDIINLMYLVDKYNKGSLETAIKYKMAEYIISQKKDCYISLDEKGEIQILISKNRKWKDKIYDITEIDKIENILKNGTEERLNESMKDNPYFQKYKYLIIKLPKEITIEQYKYSLDIISKYYDNLKINQNVLEDSFKSMKNTNEDNFMLFSKRNMEYFCIEDNLPDPIESCNYNGKIYNILTDINNIELIFKYGQTAPTYEPKKILKESLEDNSYFKKYDKMIFLIPQDMTEDEIKKSIKIINQYFNIDFFNTTLLNQIIRNIKNEQKDCFIAISSDNDFNWANINYFEEFIKSNKYDKLHNLNDISEIVSILKYGIEPNYKPKKIIRETLEIRDSYPYQFLCIKIYNNIDFDIVFNFMMEEFDLYDNYDDALNDFDDAFENNYLYMIYNLKNGDIHFNYVEYMDNLIRLNYHDEYYKDLVDPKKFNVNNLNELKKYLTIEEVKIPNYNPRKIIKESIENKKILYAFDLDDTLMFNENFENMVKHMLNENVTPEHILLNELNKIGVDIHQLKYENGRIYFNDPEEKISFPMDSCWVRKKNRIYLTKPESFLYTDYSLPIKSNRDMVKFYNNVKNKCIITVRKEIMKDKIEKILIKNNIEKPNYGLHMFSSHKYSSKFIWKSETLLKIYQDGKFTKINYYDDDIKLIKRMKNYLLDKDINMNFYKVDENGEFKLITY
jgi:hypothetical protein